MQYAVTCKGCGYVETNAWGAPDTEHAGKRTNEPLTPRGQVPVYCPKCGARSWRVPATTEDLAKYEAAQHRAQRAVELCGTLDMDGLLKIPDEIRAAAEVKNALSNLFAPLEGEVLKAAQANCVRVSRAGIAVAADVWVELYDKAVTKALEAVKAEKKGAKVA